MPKPDWARIRTLFEQAVILDAEARPAFLAHACVDEPALRAEVDALLAADARANQEATELGGAAPDLMLALHRDHQNALAGQRLGPWRLLREIGRGGMGAVYLAQRDDGEYVQQAAIKLVRPGWDLGELLQRFRAERQILATLNHPNIARLLDGGVSADGKPYLVLEYVEGSEIGQYCDTEQLTIECRLQLFLTVCAAVSHAHHRLVVHRDLKPSNIMIDATGQVKLLDFGIAKLIESKTSITGTQTRVFTPEFAAPEQLRGEVVTTSVDVYALGLLLFHLLTGRKPYGITATTPAAYEHAILNLEPQRPSQAVLDRDPDAPTQIIDCAAARQLQPQQLSTALSGDLDAIILKALRKEPEQRYASASALADDVERYLQHEPVLARRGNLRYRMTRFLQRHALASALGMIAVLSLLVGAGVALWQAEQAAAEARKSRAALDFMTGLFTLADPVATQGERVTARELLDTGSHRIREQLLDQPDARAELLLAMGDAYRGLGLFDQALPVLAESAALTRDNDRARLSHAIVLHQLGQFDESLAELGALRATVQGGLRPDQDLMDQVDLRRAVTNVSMNRLDEAGAIFDQLLQGQRTRYGERDRRTEESVIRYASWLVLRDRADEAYVLTKAIVDHQRGQSPRDNEFFARALGAHAVVVSHTGPMTEAEALRREEYDLTLAVFGDQHSYTVSSRNNLATVLFSEQRYAEALALFQSVLISRQQQLGPEHPLIALINTNIATTLVSMDRSAEARPYAETALALREQLFGENHRDTAMSLRTLGNVEFDAGRLDQAEALFRRAIASLEAAMGPSTNMLSGSLNDLVRVQLAKRQPEPDCRSAQRAFDLNDDGNPNAPIRMQYQFALLGACRALNGDPAGMTVLRNAEHRLRNELGPDDYRTRKIGALLADFDDSVRAAPAHSN
ncbi:hypothetical protein C7S18_18595 [Ahniella affigens]|uniref:Protein kinase domain-containing protein n=1 Tax=Ahniella affigens TaxID=2021234 RepID=A0A2P1PW49_9GAMM|nr:serine/threonine-protein kinase [Ahniella affigens]AVP99056.1 hypothetical protein C7S18_18595 [Ahniella affigens]